MLTAIILHILLSPTIATHVVGAALDRQDLVDDVLAICHRESRCEPVGVHERDAHLGVGWYGQVRIGHLDPDCQPYRARQWATRGAWGLSAASHWPYLPRCYAPEALDNPWTSAVVAFQKYERECLTKRRKRRGWCAVPAAVRQDNVPRAIPPRPQQPSGWLPWVWRAFVTFRAPAGVG